MLTPKQKAFADYYIECGNAEEAAVTPEEAITNWNRRTE